MGGAAKADAQNTAGEAGRGREAGAECRLQRPSDGQPLEVWRSGDKLTLCPDLNLR